MEINLIIKLETEVALRPCPARAGHAQNASGNWIKVVQRVLVRISLAPKELSAHPLRVGLSATVDIDISCKEGGALGTVAPAPARAMTTALVKTALGQPLQQAQAATDAIVAKNLAN